jgi:hypothetical protein
MRKPQKSAALMFDGVNDTINIPHHPVLNIEPQDDVSISIQIMPHDLNRKGMLIGKAGSDYDKQEGWALYHSGSDIVFSAGSDLSTGDGIVVTWKEVLKEFSWSHLRLSFTGGESPEVLLFKDGVLIKDSLRTGKFIRGVDNKFDLYIASRNNVDMAFHGKFLGCTIARNESRVSKIVANWETGFDSSFPIVKDTLGRHDGKVSNTYQSIVVYDFKKVSTYEL